jgi:hypothetical protein
MTAPNTRASGNGRRIVEYRSVITLGNVLSILAMVVTVFGAATWWYGDVQARFATLETKMEFVQSAVDAMAAKMGIELSEISAAAKGRRAR